MAVCADRGIGKDRADNLHELFVFEGRLQHASPDVEADEVRNAVELLRVVAPELLRALIAWLARRGVDVAGDAKGA